jgi:hypothetical protein
MLSEKIGGAAGKVTAQRALPNPRGGPKMETSFHNKVAAVFEYEVDGQGNSRSEIWEWK